MIRRKLPQDFSIAAIHCHERASVFAKEHQSGRCRDDPSGYRRAGSLRQLPTSGAALNINSAKALFEGFIVARTDIAPQAFPARLPLSFAFGKNVTSLERLEIIQPRNRIKGCGKPVGRTLKTWTDTVIAMRIHWQSLQLWPTVFANARRPI